MLSHLNKVFLTIKKYYQDVDLLDKRDFVELLSTEADLDIDLIKIYLSVLKNMKLIDFSLEENKYISLSELGKHIDKIPSTLSNY